MATYQYDVTVVDESGEMDPATQERLATVAAYRLETLDENEGSYPVPGGAFDMLDHFEGPFFWERTDEEMEADPPTSVAFEVVAVDPAEQPEAGATIRVEVTVPY